MPQGSEIEKKNTGVVRSGKHGRGEKWFWSVQNKKQVPAFLQANLPQHPGIHEKRKRLRGGIPSQEWEGRQWRGKKFQKTSCLKLRKREKKAINCMAYGAESILVGEHLKTLHVNLAMGKYPLPAKMGRGKAPQRQR